MMANLPTATREKALVAAVFTTLTLLSWNISSKKQHLIGDAPEYMLVAQSLIKDHDIFLENEAKIFELHRPPSWEGKEIYTNPTDPRPGTLINSQYLVNAIPKNNHLLPYHPVGLSILISPGQILFGSWGASLTIALCAALLSLNIYRHTKSLKKAVFITLSPPLIYLSLLCFKEIPASLFAFYAFRKIKQQELEKTTDKVLVGLVIFALPWLHPKYLLISGLLLFLLEREKKHRQLSAASCRLPAIFNTVHSMRYVIGILAILILSLFAFYTHFYGTWRALLTTAHPGLINPLKGLIGLLFDREYGLALNYPLYVLAIVGLLSRSRFKKEGWFPPTLIGATLLGISLFGNWHGGVAPPGRLIAPALPFLGLYFPESRHLQQKLAKIGLLVISATLVYLNIFKVGTVGCIVPNKANEVYYLLPYGKAVSDIFPSITDQSGKLEKPSDWW